MRERSEHQVQSRHSSDRPSFRWFGALLSRLIRISIGASVLAGCSEVSSEEVQRFPPAKKATALTTVQVQESDPPTLCVEPKLAKAFQNGENVGTRLIAKIWKASGTCDKLEQFTDKVMIGVQELVLEIDSDKLRKRCRYAGAIEGVLAALDVIQQNCATKCFMNGELVGPIEAKAYCDLAIDAGGDLDPVPWLRTPVGICGVEFEVACDSMFLETTTTYTNSDGICEPYTRDPYFDIWDRSRFKSCDYYQNDATRSQP